MDVIKITAVKTALMAKQLLRFFVPLSFLFLISCSSFVNPYPPSSKSERIYPPEQLRADLKSLDRALKEIHPEPFARLDYKKYLANYDQLYLDLSWPQRRSEFFRQISPLVTSLSDIHTRVLYPEQEYQKFIKLYGRFPLAVLNTDEGLIVVKDQQEKSLIPVGAKILSINDIDINSMLQKFRNYVPTETKTGEARMIQMEFSSLLRSVYQFKDTYNIIYVWQNKVHHETIKGIKQNLELNSHSAVSHYGSFSIDKDTSLIWLNDFNEQHDKFTKFLDKEFQQLKDRSKTTLILDLRYNVGGLTDNLASLLTYLSTKPISWATKATLKLSDQFRHQHALLLDSAKQQKYGNYLDWLPVEYLNSWQWDILFADDGELINTKIEPVFGGRDNTFRGKIMVLSNGYCLSACASLIATLKNNQLATIIGEAPGSFTDIQYGYPVEIELPNTGVKVVIPAMKFILETAENKPVQIIQPDYVIERSRLDVLLGKDPVFDFAYGLSKTVNLNKSH